MVFSHEFFHFSGKPLQMYDDQKANIAVLCDGTVCDMRYSVYMTVTEARQEENG